MAAKKGDDEETASVSTRLTATVLADAASSVLTPTVVAEDTVMHEESDEGGRSDASCSMETQHTSTGTSRPSRQRGAKRRTQKLERAKEHYKAAWALAVFGEQGQGWAGTSVGRALLVLAVFGEPGVGEKFGGSGSFPVRLLFSASRGGSGSVLV